MKIAIANEGTLYDKDIDVTLEFDRGVLIPHMELPIPEDNCIKRLNEDDAYEDIFGITKTISYDDYWSAVEIPTINTYKPQPSVLLYSGVDYKETYQDSLNDVFAYEYFSSGEKDILLVHFDYIKHNKSVAFPSVILVSAEIKKVTYSIRTKKLPNEIVGEITI